MEFDKSRVYTTVNADELKIGSKFIGAMNLAELKQKVRDIDVSNIYKLNKIFSEDLPRRFRGSSCYKLKPYNFVYLRTFCLAYLIEEPKEKKNGI